MTEDVKMRIDEDLCVLINTWKNDKEARYFVAILYEIRLTLRNNRNCDEELLSIIVAYNHRELLKAFLGNLFIRTS